MAIFQKSVVNKHLANLDKNLVEKAFQRFKENYSPSKIDEIRQLKEEEYQDGFLRDLFVDVFGYILKPEDNFNLVREFKNQNDGRKADGAIIDTRGDVPLAVAVIELKSTKTKDFKSVTEQAFGYKNNQPECKYVIISNFQKLRFYVDYANEYEEFDLFHINKEDFDLLYLILHKESVFSNLPLRLKEETKFHEQEVSGNLYKDYSHFKRRLFENLTKNHPGSDKLTLFKKSQKLLDRFLFILFAEDSGLLPPNSISRIIDTFHKLVELDAYKPIYEIYKQYFGYMNIGREGKTNTDNIPAYNGGLFYPDELLDSLKIDDRILINDLLKLSEYDFNTEVDVNILGHIFEHSLSEIEEITAEIEGAVIDKTKSKRKKDGVFYTPKYITQYIVENTIGTLCDEKRKELEIEEIEFDGTYKKKDETLSAKGKKLYQRLNSYKDWLLSLKIVDPACGSGAFLNQALNFLIQEHKNIDDIIAELTNTSLRLFDTDKAILENNLYGVDINEESVEIAKLSLWLRTAQKGRKLSNLNDNIKCGNSLIDDPTVAGDKAFNWNMEFKEIMDNGGFDAVIGNPPYVVHIKSLFGKQTIDYFNNRYDFSEYNPNSYALFTDLGLNTLLKQECRLGFIIPNSWLEGQYFSRMRKGVYGKSVDEIVYLKNSVFREVVETVILLCKNTNKTSSEIKLSTDVIKEEYQNIQFDSNKFIKGFNPFVTGENPLLEKLENEHSKLGDYAIVYRGLETRDNKEWLSKSKETDLHIPILLGKDVSRYNYSYSGAYVKFIKKEMKSNANELMYHKPKILMRRTGSTIISALEQENFLVLKNLYLIIPNDNMEIYSMVAQINSRLLSYFHRAKSSNENKAFAQFKGFYIESFPYVKSNSESFKTIIETITADTKLFAKTQHQFLKYLQAQFQLETFSKKLQQWHGLEFGDFIKELNQAIKKIGGVRLSKTDEMDWMEVFETKKAEAQTLKVEIDKIEKEIDWMVYELYGLSEEEIHTVEN